LAGFVEPEQSDSRWEAAIALVTQRSLEV
jgi:hypothetical protein